jgi:mono/diheme cytochrome c family protein
MKRIIFALLLTHPAAAAHADGKAVYDKSCKSCHAEDGKGNAKMAGNLKIDAGLLNLGRDEIKDLTRDQLKAIVSDGKEKMPAYGKKLAGADLDAALDYAMELAKTIRGGK